MPRDLFGDVAKPGVGLGSRQWYTLPLSLVVHAVLLAAAVITPLMAAGVLPAPARGLPDFLQAAPAAPPDVPPPAPQSRPAQTVPAPLAGPDAPPLTAPDGIRDETGLVEPERQAAGIEGGVPAGVVGSILGGLPEAPPPPAPPAAPIRLHSGIRPPAKTTDVVPVYPPIAVQARVQGLVILEAIIDQDGTVRDARVLRSVPLLDQAAVDAVRRWRFSPALLNGEPVAVVMTVTVAFKLD